MRLVLAMLLLTGCGASGYCANTSERVIPPQPNVPGSHCTCDETASQIEKAQTWRCTVDAP